MVAIAETIIERRFGAFEPVSFRDRYQDAQRELVEAKTKGLATTPRAIAEPPKIIHLMEALKRIKATGSAAATLVGADPAQISHAWFARGPFFGSGSASARRYRAKAAEEGRMAVSIAPVPLTSRWRVHSRAYVSPLNVSQV
jgi:hypothetical protein